MFPPFLQDEAFRECIKIIVSIKNGKTCLKQISKISNERKNQGLMIGSLVCQNKKGKKIVLNTVSGNSKILKNLPNGNFFVKPIVSSKRIWWALLRNDKKIHELTKKINATESAKLKSLRTKLTTQSLLRVFRLYSFVCFDKKRRSLLSICGNCDFKNHETKLPPTGTGDCCAPKLLNYAFLHNLQPLSMAEVFFGGETVNKKNLHLYEPCNERCSLILPGILGINIVYRDEHIIVVNKQSGILSVPGRGKHKQDSISYRVRRLFPKSCLIEQPCVHRLDMETSGLMVLAFTKQAHKNLNKQFENRQVYKEYIALLSGKVLQSPQTNEKNIIELYFRVDLENRPHQIYDEIYGKKAVTEYQILNTEYYTSPNGKRILATRVKFIPHTGRTHQLRLASSDIRGLNCPIIGDSLYGTCQKGERLMLQARVLEFTHPFTNQKMRFELQADF